MVANNKIYFKLLDESLQPVKTILRPQADVIKLVEVLDVGHKVEIAKKGDILHLYVATMIITEYDKGFCSDRDVLFVNEIPQAGKVHITNQEKDPLNPLSTANVINSNSEGIDKNDKIYYRSGQSLILPDNTEILSDSQIYRMEK